MIEMTYVLVAGNNEDPCPYAWYGVQREPAPGQEYMDWVNVMDGGGAVRPEFAPRTVLRAIYEPKDYPCAQYSPDYSYVIGGYPCVSERLRNIIESLEPGIHQLFPVDMLDADGSTREPRRYILNVCNVADAVISGTDLTGTGKFVVNKSNAVKIRKFAVEGLHLWIDRRVPIEKVFVSDLFYGKLVREGIGVFEALPVEEV